MPYINKNPNEDFVFFLKVLIFTLLAFYLLFGLTKVAFGFENGNGLDIDEMGYYSLPYESSVNDGDFVIFTGEDSTYILDGAPPVEPEYYFGGHLKGTIGSSTAGTFHALGSDCDDGTCIVERVEDDWTTIAEGWEQGQDFLIAIFSWNVACLSYFQYGEGSCPEVYGIYELKWGEEGYENDINFTEPVGQQEGYAPFFVDVEGDFEIASTTTYWTDIEIEMTFYSPPDYATSSVSTKYIALQNAQNKGIGTFSDEDNALYWSVIDGTYVYRARFIESYYGDVATTSEWFYNEGAYWLFEVGAEGGGLPSMEDYFATTTDFGLLGNMFRDVLLWLFKPSTQVLDYWYSIKDMVANKPPFGYYTLVKNAFDELNSEATPAFSLQTATSTATYIFTPLKTGLGWIFWILFGVWFIKRFVHFVI